MRILVVTRSYPQVDDLYQYPFVHRRVLAYVAAGHEVRVFRPAARPGAHIFEGVLCLSGNASALAALVEDFEPDVLSVHGLNENMWEVLKPVSDLPIRAWLHGSEIPGIFRAKSECLDEPARSEALRSVTERCEFWKAFLATRRENSKLVFVSRSAARLAFEDIPLEPSDFTVIHNPIDTDLFAYRAKSPEDRLRILMIRPFESYCYGNDLAVRAIGHLRNKEGFERLHVTIIGDGPMFDETVAPVCGLPNLTLVRRFLTQAEIVEEHGRNGVFLVPTRLDTQGVSRDEAMSSGLVPVTNAVSAVPEFVDESCAGLAGPEDVFGLAEAIWALAQDVDEFLAKSRADADRVRLQSGADTIIPAELALLEGAIRD
jgi:glycosyltransferase involved in cell wall biosynthesis